MAHANAIPDVQPRGPRAETVFVASRIEKNGPLHRALVAYCERGKFSTASVIEAALADYLRERAKRDKLDGAR